MLSKQDELGKKTEIKIADFFKKHKYWALIIPRTINGQPFDIIARKGNKTWFVDAKHLESSKASFPFSRIEPNQESSMLYAFSYADIKEDMGFIIEWERTGNLYFLNYSKYKELQKKGEKSVKIEFLEDLELLVE